MDKKAGSNLKIRSLVTVELKGKDGKVKHSQQFHNKVTTPGDEFIAKAVAAGITPATPSAPSLPTGMKLGTGSTAPGKSTTGHVLGSYISGSNNAFDATYPQVEAVSGTDAGWKVIFRTTWAAGDSTNSTINEVIICLDQSSNLTSSAANTLARAVFSSTVNKAAEDSLEVTWEWTFQG